MIFSDNAHGQALDAMTLTHLSVAAAYPGRTGAAEISTARLAATFAAASGSPRTRALSSPVSIAVAQGASQIARWVQAHTALTSGTFQAAIPVQSTGMKAYTVDATNNLIQCRAHGYALNSKVVFFSNTAPGGLTEGTVYYVVNPTTDSFQVAASASGSAIDLTNTVNSAFLSNIVELDFTGAPGSVDVNTFTIPGIIGQ